ncbi:MAG TPA: hypothetical protein ENN81_01625 [Phycisphaerales bacterium]|nr:hypothetical protein [Phycisphaerales bacterium]
MDDIANDKKRVITVRRQRLTVYRACGWPGWRDIAITLCGAVIIAVILGGMLVLLHTVRSVLKDVAPYPWLNRVLGWLITGSVDLSFVAVLAFCLVWLPYFLLYQLSPKEFWIEDGRICHTVRLLGLLPRTRRIPFDRITEIAIAPSGSIFHLKAIYIVRLPRLIHFFVAYWTDKPLRWPLTLVNAIPTRREAEQIQLQLLEPMTRAAAPCG